jgi:aspartate racemase
MGPAATADFYAKLIEATPARRDQDHRRVVIWADPTVPDRTDALRGRAPDPTPWLVEGAQWLQEAGATHLAIPCNTAHVFVPALSERVGLTIVHMIDEVARRLSGWTPHVRRVGLLATDGTVGSGLYQEWLERVGIETVLPTAQRQAAVMAAILAIKAGRRRGADVEVLSRVALELIDGGAEAIVAGCTEIPLGLSSDDVDVPVIDPARELARAVVAATASDALH